MKFMLEFPARDSSLFQGMPPEILREWLDRLNAGLENGSIDSAYSKVGGGGYFVVSADDDKQLRRALRGLGIHDVNVHPVSATADVIQGYLDYHESGEHEEHVSKVAAEVVRMQELF